MFYWLLVSTLLTRHSQTFLYHQPSNEIYLCIYCSPSRLRHCATSREVAGSIPDGVIIIFHWHNPSGRTMALGLTQPLTEMITRNISWGVNTVGVKGWQSYHLRRMTIVLKSGSLNLLEPSGLVQACNGIAFYTMVLSAPADKNPKHWCHLVVELYLENRVFTNIYLCELFSLFC